MSREFIAICRHGHVGGRGRTAANAVGNIFFPCGAECVVAIIAKELWHTPQQNAGAYTAVIGNLVTEGGEKR